MADENADYVTVARTLHEHEWLVSVMRWNQAEDSYIMRESAGPLPYLGAVQLAQQWAREKGLEVR